MLQETSTFNPPSTAQSQTSYPSGPSQENPPRRRIMGGFVIDVATCIAWGSRISQTPLNPEVENDCVAAFCFIVNKIEGPYHVYFTMFGPECYKQYMIVTQSAPFQGWKGMDPELIPKFEEREREAIARELLKAEGITEYEFRTELF